MSEARTGIRWIGSLQDESLEVELAPGSAAILLIPHADLDPSAAARLAIGPADRLCAMVLERGDHNWLQDSGLVADEVATVRLIGDAAFHARLESAAGGFEQLSFGKPLVLDSPFPTLLFLPRDGRLRVPRGALKPSLKPLLAPSLAPSSNGPASAGKKRVLIVDDSETIGKLLTRILSEDPELEVVGAVLRPSLVDAAIRELRPDVLTLDIHMPEMNGVELLRRLLPRYRLPAVMISSLSREDGTYVLDALEAGAIDYIQKPSAHEIGAVGPLIREKVRTAASSQVLVGKGTLAGATPGAGIRRAPLAHARAVQVDLNHLIVIGSSTGGTEALKQVLTGLPAQIPPILVVQHIPPVFSRAFAERMNTLCPFDVREAEDGDLVRPSQVLIAPGGKQMKVRASQGDLRVLIDDSEPVNRHKPSVDVLFASVASLNRKKVVAAMLTGMGNDGARGMLQLRQLGARTIAQDEATCVVYGMPKAAVELGAAEMITPLPLIADQLLQLSERKRGAA